ncbi:YcjF family protein [Myxococcus stipitatus]|uniref:YcjF family protein n=1 Tax=Myxococcus stipitatus TaxID=83455 RepID=UPI0030D2E8B3
MELHLAEEIRKQVDEAFRKRGRVNIVIAGRSGVGKSTLINAVFHGRIADTGQGRPVTRETREYTKDGIPVSILDTRGMELGAFKETLTHLEDLVATRARDSDATRHLHCAWMCIGEDSRRVEEGDLEVARMLARHMPVIAVITKARNDQGFLTEVEKLLPVARNVMRVRALLETDDEGHTLHPRGLVELVELTMELVPEAQRNAFAAAQRVSIGQKRKRAHGIVASAAATAAAIGATPIPFADAALLVPTQVGMLAGISSVFGLPLTEAFLSTLVSSVATGLGATFSGQAIVSGLLKLLPGAGSLVGALIAATTATTLTTLFGEAYIAVLSTLMERRSGELPEEDEVIRAFREELTLRRATA